MRGGDGCVGRGLFTSEGVKIKYTVRVCALLHAPLLGSDQILWIICTCTPSKYLFVSPLAEESMDTTVIETKVDK